MQYFALSILKFDIVNAKTTNPEKNLRWFNLSRAQYYYCIIIPFLIKGAVAYDFRTLFYLKLITPAPLCNRYEYRVVSNFVASSWIYSQNWLNFTNISTNSWSNFRKQSRGKWNFIKRTCAENILAHFLNNMIGSLFELVPLLHLDLLELRGCNEAVPVAGWTKYHVLRRIRCNTM